MRDLHPRDDRCAQLMRKTGGVGVERMRFEEKNLLDGSEAE